jgi:hypothetical protein
LAWGKELTHELDYVLRFSLAEGACALFQESPEASARTFAGFARGCAMSRLGLLTSRLQELRIDEDVFLAHVKQSSMAALSDDLVDYWLGGLDTYLRRLAAKQEETQIAFP